MLGSTDRRIAELFRSPDRTVVDLLVLEVDAVEHLEPQFLRHDLLRRLAEPLPLRSTVDHLCLLPRRPRAGRPSRP